MGPDVFSEPFPGAIPRVRTQGRETAGEVAFALLDALWAGPVGLALFDADLCFQHVNEAVAEMNRLPAEAHVGHTLRELFGGGEARNAGAIPRIEDALRAVVETGRPRLNLVVPGVDEGGAAREWLCSYYPVAGPSGEVRGVCAVITDATDDRDREQALRQARDHAQAAARRLALLQETTAALSAAVDPAEVAEVVVSCAGPVVGAFDATLRVLAGDRLEVLATRGAGGGLAHRFARIPVDADAPPSVAVRRDEALWLESAEVVRARFPAFAAEAGDAIRGAWVVVPLSVRGRALGSLGFSFEGPRAFDLEERAFVLSLAEQSAQALDRARLLQEERARRALHQRTSERVARIQAITAALSQARTVEDVASVMVLQAHEALAVDVATAYGRGAEGLELLAAVGIDPEVRARWARLPLGADLPVAEVVRTGEPLWFTSREEQLARYPALAAIPKARHLPGLAAVPLRCGAQVLGAVAFSFRSRRPLSHAGRELLVATADLCGQALERARLLDAERAARAELERSQALLDAVLDNAPVGIGFWDRGLRFARLNQRLADTNGLSVEAHLGKTVRELLPGLPVEQLEDAFRAVLEEGRTIIEAPFEGETHAAPGRVRHWLSSFYPVRAGGETVGIGGIVREVTAQREAEEFQRNVLGIVGHDLRNPLSALLLAARLLRREPDVPEHVKVLVERMQRAADRMDGIVAVLLDYTRVRGGHGIPVRPVECALDALVLSVVEECEAARPGREVRTRVEGDGNGRWDRDRIEQVIQNLVSNALDHGAPGEPVEVTFRGLAAEVVVDVRNAGPPIPPDVLPGLFDPFRRAESAQPRHQGLGLGLFIARAIVEAHRGTIAARSAEKDGTVFTVRLPRWVEGGERGRE